MTPISIYRNLLLPDITEFCQNFFPSFVEYSYDENKEPPHAQQKEKINNCTSLFMLWLKNSLSFDETPIDADIYFVLKNNADINEAERLNQYLTFATTSKIDSKNNPLSPNNIISALAYYIETTNHNKTIQLIEHLQTQFNEVAYGFYKKLNSLCDHYFKEIIDDNIHSYSEKIIYGNTDTDINNNYIQNSDNNYIYNSDNSYIYNSPNNYIYNNPNNYTYSSHNRYHKPAPPITDLDAPTIVNMSHAPVHTPNIIEAENIINAIKQLFRENLTEEKLHPSIYKATKKLYFPLINSAISCSTNASTVATIHDITDHISQLTSTADHQKLVRAQQIICNFVQQALNQTTELNTLCLQLAVLTNAESRQTKTITAAPAPENTQALATAQISEPHLTGTPPITPSRIQKLFAPNQSLATKLSTADIKKGARETIANKLKEASQSIAHQLQDDWTRVLVVTGNIHGVHSAQWQNCAETFYQLTHFATLKEIPLPLLYKIEAQLQFAGISTDELELTSSTTTASQGAEVANIKEGSWFEFSNNDEHITRCKLAAIIKQIGLYIFVTKHGKKVLEIHQSELQTYLDSGKLMPLQAASLNNTLEDVLRNIKQAQNPELESSH